MSAKRLRIVALNYNGGLSLTDNLQRLWQDHDQAWELVVVDNASGDGSIEFLQSAISDVHVIRNASNRGFAAGNNRALRDVSSDYVLLLNPDVVVAGAEVRKALEYMDANVDVGILGGRILLTSGGEDPAAHRSFKTPSTYLYKVAGLSRAFPRSRRFGRYYTTFADPSKIRDVDSVTGAFLMIRRQTLEEVGLLDERFFMYCEDEDWCWRAKLAGWRVVYHPEIVVHHAKGSSARRHPLRMTWEWHRSLILYHHKNIAPRYPLPVNVAVYAGIGSVLAARLAVAGVRLPLRSRRAGISA